MISSLVNCVRRSLPLVCHEYEILDANTRIAGEIDPGLDRDNVPRLEHVGRVGPERRPFVDLEADAVAEAVAVRPAELGCLDRNPGSGVRVAPMHLRPDGREACELGFETERVKLRQPLRHFSHRKRARAVGAVALHDATRVDGDEHTCLDRLIARHCVG